MAYGTRMLLIVIFFVLQRSTWPVESAKILAVETVAGMSHWNFMSAVLRSLTDAGHSVTVFTPFPEGDRANYAEVDTSKFFPLKIDYDIRECISNYSGPTTMMNIWIPMIREYSEMTCGNEQFREIIRAGFKNDFELIIMEPYVSDCMSYLFNALDLPIIYTIPSTMFMFSEFNALGHMANPAYVTHLLSEYAVPKTFVQRFTNVAHLIYGYCINTYQTFLLKKNDPKPYDSAPKVVPSVVFFNTHYITDAPRPISPNLIGVGGVHLKPPKSLPKDLLDFIENSTHGVIYFSFGSIIKLSSLPRQIEDIFKEAFVQVPQNIMWKYEGEMKNKPKNVMINKWFPQRDVLLHPNVKLFISHGGISGVYESVDGSVPVLGFPLLYDQPRNIDHLVHNEMAISMDLLTVTKDKLLNAINELINNTKYTKNAKINSIRFKDRPMSPQQSVVYWTEYVIRHKGAPHLKAQSLNLTWYQYFLLDVVFMFLIVISLITYMIYTIIKIAFKYIMNRSLITRIKTKSN